MRRPVINQMQPNCSRHAQDQTPGIQLRPNGKIHFFERFVPAKKDVQKQLFVPGTIRPGQDFLLQPMRFHEGRPPTAGDVHKQQLGVRGRGHIRCGRTTFF